jgi:hypothetical protein
MFRVILLRSVAAFLVLFFPFDAALAQQDSQPLIPAESRSEPATSSLKVCLRLEDESPFWGAAGVRVVSGDGHEIVGTPAVSEGELLFSGMQPGTYGVEATAPGFLTVRIVTKIETSHPLRTLFIAMKPKPPPGKITPASLASPPTTRDDILVKSPWLSATLAEAISDVDPNVVCPAEQVLNGVGQRMTQFTKNLEKFTATERVEHFRIDSIGARRSSDVRNFAYVVTISKNPAGMFVLDEYRDGGTDPAQFPAGIATRGLPALALIFHPLLSGDFKFQCEGLGGWKGQPAWQIHFSQRPDKPSRIRVYKIAAQIYRIPIKGRVWVDPGSLQVLHLDSELVNPIGEIALKIERASIDYGLVQFRSQAQGVWLPQTAELWVERAGRRYCRLHSFSNFKLFSVDTSQSIQTPEQSYRFTNTTDSDLVGVLTVTPVTGANVDPVSINFTIPARRTIFKFVGPGKDVSIPAALIESAVFSHSGMPASINADANLSKQSSLDVIPQSSFPANP